MAENMVNPGYVPFVLEKNMYYAEGVFHWCPLALVHLYHFKSVSYPCC